MQPDVCRRLRYLRDELHAVERIMQQAVAALLLMRTRLHCSEQLLEPRLSNKEHWQLTHRLHLHVSQLLEWLVLQHLPCQVRSFTRLQRVQ